MFSNGLRDINCRLYGQPGSMSYTRFMFYTV